MVWSVFTTLGLAFLISTCLVHCKGQKQCVFTVTAVPAGSELWPVLLVESLNSRADPLSTLFLFTDLHSLVQLPLAESGHAD
jgi:hypothetical protein